MEPGSPRKQGALRLLRERTQREWVNRAVLAGIAVFLGYLSVTSSFATVLERIDPEKAYALAPRMGVIAASRARQAMQQLGSDESLDVERLARTALVLDPTAADALNVLGAKAQIEGETERARSIFSYSLLLSRRELEPRLWAIEEAVDRGDISEALRNYDIALRTSSTAAELLLPTLVSALDSEKVRRELLEVLRTRPPWSDDFLWLASRAPTEPMAVEALFDEAARVDIPISQRLRENLVNSFIRNGQFDEAWAYFSSFRANVDRRKSQDSHFTLRTETRTHFDWTPSEVSGVSVAILSDGNGGSLDFATSPGFGGALVQQYTLLLPGAYRLVGRSQAISIDDGAQPYWLLSCKSGRELARVDVPNSDLSEGRFSSTLTVPPDCPVQILSLMARSSNSMTGVSGQILSAGIVPAE